MAKRSAPRLCVEHLESRQLLDGSLPAYGAPPATAWAAAHPPADAAQVRTQPPWQGPWAAQAPAVEGRPFVAPWGGDLPHENERLAAVFGPPDGGAAGLSHAFFLVVAEVAEGGGQPAASLPVLGLAGGVDGPLLSRSPDGPSEMSNLFVSVAAAAGTRPAAAVPAAPSLSPVPVPAQPPVVPPPPAAPALGVVDRAFATWTSLPAAPAVLAAAPSPPAVTQGAASSGTPDRGVPAVAVPAGVVPGESAAEPAAREAPAPQTAGLLDGAAFSLEPLDEAVRELFAELPAVGGAGLLRWVSVCGLLGGALAVLATLRPAPEPAFAEEELR